MLFNYLTDNQMIVEEEVDLQSIVFNILD